MNGIYWLRKGGGAYNGRCLERPEKLWETVISQKLPSPMPLSSQMAEPELYPKPIDACIVHYFEMETLH